MTCMMVLADELTNFFAVVDLELGLAISFLSMSTSTYTTSPTARLLSAVEVLVLLMV